MLFNSLHFLFFFPFVVFIYFSIPHRYRWILLLIASYYFYMCWKAEYAILLLGSTTIDYCAGLWMGRLEKQAHRRLLLILSLAVNFGILFTFKYFNFFSDSVHAALAHWNIFYDVPAYRFLLPVGVSFYTFQSLSYVIDVYRRDIKPEKHFGIFALYVSFFPQLVAGPIERSGRLLPQFYPEHKFDYDRMRSGLVQMGWGFFKKLVIADRLAVMVNQVYGHLNDYTGIPLIIVMYAFALQIYCDFSGYSDIAVGAARVMGFDLMQNFRRPYLAKSIAELWQRWHISLTTWFRDYVYAALKGVNDQAWARNIMIVFIASGLWHGANWTFILYRWARPVTAKLPNALMVFITGTLFSMTLILFRSPDFKAAWYYLTHMFSGISLKGGYHMGLGPTESMVAVVAVAGMFVFELFEERKAVFPTIFTRPLYQRWLIYYALIFVTLVFGRFESSKEFIYFQF
jgi:alginate O-acetyltransferase complex protein AlgI